MMPITITKKLLGIDYPITIHPDEILSYWISEKGTLIEFIEKSLIELKKEDSEIVKLQLKRLKNLL